MSDDSLWFRWYVIALEDGKFRAVTRVANALLPEREKGIHGEAAGDTVVTHRDTVALWLAMLSDASHPDHRGVAQRGLEYYAGVLDWDETVITVVIDAMVEIGIAQGKVGNLVITNWNKRQFETDWRDPSNAERQRRKRDRARHGEDTVATRNGHGATRSRHAPDTDTDSDTESSIDSSHIPESSLIGERGPGKTKTAASPAHPPPESRNKNNISEKGKSATQAQPSQPAQLTPVPADFTPDAGDYAEGAKLGMAKPAVDAAVPRFIFYFSSRGDLRADWHAAFRDRLHQLGEQKNKSAAGATAGGSSVGVSPRHVPVVPGAFNAADPVEWEKSCKARGLDPKFADPKPKPPAAP